MNINEQKNIGEKVRQARVLAKLTQQELADKVQIDRVALIRVESGKRQVGANELKKISEITDKPLLFFYEEEEPSISFNHRNPINKYSDLKDENKKFVDKLIETLKKMENEP